MGAYISYEQRRMDGRVEWRLQEGKEGYVPQSRRRDLLARASFYKHVSLGSQDLDRSLGRHVRPYTETRQPIRPKDPAVPRGGECYKAYPGKGNRSIFYPGSSVGSTITMWVVGTLMGGRVPIDRRPVRTPGTFAAHLHVMVHLYMTVYQV